MEEIWGMDIESDERTVDVHIKRIREKLKDFNEFKIITVRGLGYKAERNI
jgi:two-component system, OmpR family, response regulator